MATSKVKSLKKGAILSETSFYTVKSVNDDNIVVQNDDGVEVRIGNDYAEKILIVADYSEKEEKKTMTELADLFISNPRVAMTVCFITKDTEKSKKEFENEKKAKLAEIEKAPVSAVSKLLEDLIENPISRTIPGEERVMKGRHYGSVNELGRVSFIDMEESKKPGATYDSRVRQVDPRTIQYLILNGVKYTLK